MKNTDHSIAFIVDDDLAYGQKIIILTNFLEVELKAKNKIIIDSNKAEEKTKFNVFDRTVVWFCARKSISLHVILKLTKINCVRCQNLLKK